MLSAILLGHVELGHVELPATVLLWLVRFRCAVALGLFRLLFGLRRSFLRLRGFGTISWRWRAVGFALVQTVVWRHHITLFLTLVKTIVGLRS